MTRGYSAIALYRPKSADNYGTAMRSAHAFGVSFAQIIGARFRRQASDTVKSWRTMPVMCVDAFAPPYDCVPVAVELADGAIPLPTFSHPERAIYLFGPEDGSLPESVMQRCAARVAIPGRVCLNLASAVTVVLYDRAAKACDLRLARRRLAARTQPEAVDTP